MNTKDSYLFTDLQLAIEAADHQAEKWGMRYGVARHPSKDDQYLVTVNYAHSGFKEVLYITEAPHDR